MLKKGEQVIDAAHEQPTVEKQCVDNLSRSRRPPRESPRVEMMQPRLPAQLGFWVNTKRSNYRQRAFSRVVCYVPAHVADAGARDRML
jgi:hypothetical protein